MSEIKITVVVVPRDRFSHTKKSLESIYECADIPFELIYVDGGTPDHIRDYLKKVSQEKNFQLIRVDRLITANHARNLGWKHAKTPYILFVDNDVLVTKGFMSAMYRCIQETDCDVVGPVTCQDFPIHENIHFLSGDLEVGEKIQDGKTQRVLQEKMRYKQGLKWFEITPPIQREETGFVEAHCYMVKVDMLKKINGFDEEVLSTRDHIDFSLSVRNAGGKIMFEPKAVITFMGHFGAEKMDPWDETYYNFRWSDEWELRSLKRLCKKWNLSEDQYFNNRYSKLGWRRRVVVIKPKIAKIRPAIIRKFLEEIMVFLDKLKNKNMTNEYIKKYGMPQSS